MNYSSSYPFVFFGVSLFTVLMFSGLYGFSFDLNFILYSNIDIRLLVMFLLAEPHFAMTIPLLVGYRSKFKLAPIYFIYIPILIIIIAAFLFKFNLFIFSILFLLFNLYHVNRQSRGFFILQTGIHRKHGELYEWLLHFSVIIFFVIKFINLFNPIIWLITLLTATFLSCQLFWKLNGLQNPRLKDILVFSQGFLIFLPIAIFDDLLLAFAVGISIHYIQYLFISWPVCRKSFGFSGLYLLIFLFAYALISTSALGGFITNEKNSIFILIPTTLQLLHFYFDGFIWRRSDPLINKILLKAK